MCSCVSRLVYNTAIWNLSVRGSQQLKYRSGGERCPCSELLLVFDSILWVKLL